MSVERFRPREAEPTSASALLQLARELERTALVELIDHLDAALALTQERLAVGLLPPNLLAALKAAAPDLQRKAVGLRSLL